MIRRATSRTRGLRVTRGDVRLDMGRRRDGQRRRRRGRTPPSPGTPTGRGRPARSRAGPGRRPASRPRPRALPPGALRRSARPPSRARGPRRSPARRNRVDVLGRDRRARPSPPGDVGAGAAGPGLAAQRADLEQVGHGDLGVRQRVVGRDEALVAHHRWTTSHGTRRGGAARRGCGRSRPAPSRRSSPSGRGRGR